jgi:predicted PurR-regulated permease PerM
MFRKQFRVSKEDSVFFTIIWPLFLFAIILAYIIYIVVSFLEKIWECVKDYLP